MDLSLRASDSLRDDQMQKVYNTLGIGKNMDGATISGKTISGTSSVSSSEPERGVGGTSLFILGLAGREACSSSGTIAGEFSSGRLGGTEDDEDADKFGSSSLMPTM
jgi:hypothetical protein